MFEQLKNHRRLLYTLVFLVPVFGMHVPISKFSLTLFPAVLVLAAEWKHVQVHPELKRILLLFAAYLLVFTVLTDDYGRSLKGSYDILRGMAHFPIALLLSAYARDQKIAVLIKAAAVLLVLAQFLFPRGEFYGFYINPNNNAVMLVFLLCLTLPAGSSPRSRLAEISIGSVGLLVALYLMVLSNSRAAWLGCALAVVALVIFKKSLSPRVRLAAVGVVAASLVAALVFFNEKGISLSLRDVIWQGVFQETLDKRPWLGYGINYAKELMPAIDVPFLTTHNLFLELFVSSGLIGLAFMLYIFYRLMRHYLRFEFDRTALFYSGILGLIAFVVMAQFDLKFASYRFFGTHCFLLGLIYAHRRPLAQTPSDNADGAAP